MRNSQLGGLLVLIVSISFAVFWGWLNCIERSIVRGYLFWSYRRYPETLCSRFSSGWSQHWIRLLCVDWCLQLSSSLSLLSHCKLRLPRLRSLCWFWFECDCQGIRQEPRLWRKNYLGSVQKKDFYLARILRNGSRNRLEHLQSGCSLHLCHGSYGNWIYDLRRFGSSPGKNSEGGPQHTSSIRSLLRGYLVPKLQYLLRSKQWGKNNLSC